MPPFFAVTVDPARDLVRMTLGGFFDEAALLVLLEERRRKVAMLRCGAGQQLTLIDLRDIIIQTQPMVVRFNAILADPAFQSRKLAFVVSSVLARMQLLRIVGHRSAEVFTDIGKAEAWLLEGEPVRIVA